METDQPIECIPCWQDCDVKVDLSSLCRVVSDKCQPAILGGNNSVEGVSVFTAEPVEFFEFSLSDTHPFEKLSAFLSRYRLKEDCTDIPAGVFFGGWIGFFGYELGRFIEYLPERAVDDLGFGVIRLAFYDTAILYDHAKQQFSLVALDYRDEDVNMKFKNLRSWLQDAQTIKVPEPTNSDAIVSDIEAYQCNMTQAQYFDALTKTHQYIFDGEVYQINFSQRFGSDFTAAPIDLFHWQNRFNPSPYAAFLSWDDRAIVSASPELFLKVCDDHVSTRPIKGTRPRDGSIGDDAAENRTQFYELVESEKDQAELAMIVDLERNDLAKICIPGTRHVTCAREIESFPTVYHAVGVVEGTLVSAPGPQRIVDLLMAAFPGGSITGAPKIRAMEIIDELEPTARGVYTGSIGWIGINFDLCLNIAIRTILLDGQKAYVQTGGGIVADSDSQAEWDETLTKAEALLRGIQMVVGLKHQS